PGPLRPRDPPPPGPGQLRVQLLLGRLVRRSPAAARQLGTAATARPRREGGRTPPAPSWPRALRAVRAWLSPWTVLQRWWTAWSNAPPPPQLQALIDSVTTGHGLNLYLPP